MQVNYNGLFNILKDKGVTLSQIGNDLGLSSATIAKFNKGEFVSLKTLKSICIYLDVNLDEIVSFDAVESNVPLYNRLLEEMTNKIKGGIYHETQILLTQIILKVVSYLLCKLDIFLKQTQFQVKIIRH